MYHRNTITQLCRGWGRVHITPFSITDKPFLLITIQTIEALEIRNIHMTASTYPQGCNMFERVIRWRGQFESGAEYWYATLIFCNQHHQIQLPRWFHVIFMWGIIYILSLVGANPKIIFDDLFATGINNIWTIRCLCLHKSCTCR